MSQYRFKQSFSADPSLSDKLFDLLEVTFPGLSSAAEWGRKLGAFWETASTPFIRFHDDIAITHVGVLEIPMQIMGQRLTVGGIHAVATRPEFRRRGYYREVMEEVLEYCVGVARRRHRLYETLVLTTSQPEFYLPFGFRIVEEHIFKVKCDSTGSTDSFRILDFTDIKDFTLLHRLLETRAPVSNIVGVVKEKPLFCVNEGSRPLYYAEDLDLIACMEIEDTRLHLFDLVTTQICPLKNILAKIPQPIEEVVIYFSPELLHVKDVQAFAHAFDETVLMVRGKESSGGREIYAVPFCKVLSYSKTIES